MRSKIQILILFFIFLSCKKTINEGSNTGFINDTVEIEIDSSNLKINDSFLEFSIEAYLSDKLLIGKKAKLKGFKSLNIKGHRFYELDNKGNITAAYDISNNYNVYTYDYKNRLVKSENKQHSPPEVYFDVEYKYSKNDSVIEIIKTSYEQNKYVKSEIIKDDILLNNEGVNKIYFKDKQDNKYYANLMKGEIITFKEKMFFCCGETMEGKNKLNYYFNKNELIDSLIIESLENSKKMKFEYEYD